MSKKPWWCKYIGIPFADNGRDFEGIDCGGLVILAYLREFGLVLPDHYSYMYNNIHTLNKTILHFMRDAGFKKTDVISDKNVILFARGGIPYHVGLYADVNNMLHAKDGDCVKLVNLQTYNNRCDIEGYYKIY